MERRTSNLVWNRAALQAFLTSIDQAAAGPAGVLDQAAIGLYTNDFTPHPDMVIGDFTAAVFGGYAPDTTLALLGPFNVLEVGLAMLQQFTFAATAPIGTPQTVVGYYIGSAAFAAILAAERFADPVPFAIAGDFLALDLILQLPFVWPASEAA